LCEGLTMEEEQVTVTSNVINKITLP